jgi:hypothetical protein
MNIKFRSSDNTIHQPRHDLLLSLFFDYPALLTQEDLTKKCILYKTACQQFISGYYRQKRNFEGSPTKCGD